MAENNLLKKLVSEMEDKNEILKENNKLLLEKIFTLQTNTKLNRQKLSISDVTNNNPSLNLQEKADKEDETIEFQSKTGRTNNENLTNTEANKPNLTKQGNASPHTTQTIMGRTYASTVKQDSCQQKINETRNNQPVAKNKPISLKEVQEAVNLASNLRREHNSGNVIEGKITKRNITKPTKNIGQAKDSEEDNSIGIQRKAWMYINRVNQHVTEDVILAYLNKKNLADPQYEVEELKSNNNKVSKSFRVGARIELLNELYKPTFWPQGVGFRRYNFQRKPKDFL